MPDNVTMPNPVDRTGGIGNSIASIIDLIRGVQGTDIDNAREAAAMADPYAQWRGERMKDLDAFLKDPNKLREDPGYKFALNEGLDSVAAKGNAMFGTTRSGNTAIALEKFGVGFADQAYNKRLDQLMHLAGVDSGSPAEAGRLLTQGPKDRDKTVGGGLAGLDKILGGGAGGLAGIGKVIAGLFGGKLPPNIADLFSGEGPGLENLTTEDIQNLFGVDDVSQITDLIEGGGGGIEDINLEDLFGGSGDFGLDEIFASGDIFGNT